MSDGLFNRFKLLLLLLLLLLLVVAAVVVSVGDGADAAADDIPPWLRAEEGVVDVDNCVGVVGDSPPSSSLSSSPSRGEIAARYRDRADMMIV